MADNKGVDYSWVTSDLAANPGLATDVYNSGNPGNNSYIVSHAVRGVATADAIAEHSSEFGTQSFWEKSGVNIFKALDFLAKPLHEVQRDYKFIHSVYTKHGFLKGFEATAAIAAGAAGGFLVGGPVGAVLGADAAAAGTRKILGNVYKDSYADSENPDYKVSAGRDFSNALAKISDALGAEGVAQQLRTTDKGLFGSKGSFISGITDATFDVLMDPINILGRFNFLMKNGKYIDAKIVGKEVELQAKYPMLKVTPGVQNFFLARSGRVFTPAQMDMVYKSGETSAVGRNYRRALDDIANSTSGEIAIKYPELGAAAAGRLGAINKPDQVHDFLKTSVYFGELAGTLSGHAILPSRTLLKGKLIEPVQKALRGDTATTDIAKEQNIIRRAYKTFSGYMPYSVNPETGKLSTQRFKWNSPDAASGIYRVARFGMGSRYGMEMAGKYAEAVAVGDIGLAKTIKAQTEFDALKAMGLPDDNKLVLAAKEELEKTITEPLGQQVYGVAPDIRGANVSTYISKANGGPLTSALTPSQTSDTFKFVDFLQAKKVVRDAGKMSKIYGNFDEFIARYYTNTIFKPLALGTLGFAQRIVASELIPTIARYGLINTFKAKLAGSAAKANYNLIKGEDKNIFAAAMVALGLKEGMPTDVAVTGYPAFKQAKALGLNKAAETTADEQLDIATRLILNNNGHMISEATASGHGQDASVAYGARQAAHGWFQIQNKTWKNKQGPDFTTYTADSPHFLPTYGTQIIKWSGDKSGQYISKDIAESFAGVKKVTLEEELGNKNYAKYLNMRKQVIDKEYERIMAQKRGEFKDYNGDARLLQRWKDQDPYQLATDRVDAVLGLTIGKDGTYLGKVAERMSEGKAFTMDELAAFDARSLPSGVAGPQIESFFGRNMLNNIIDLGFKKVIDPVINNLSREPLYLLHVTDEYQSLKYLIAKGHISEDQALRFAEYRATHAMLPQIHNTALRTQFSQLARNYLPFWFAQEQAMKRTFRLLKDTSVVSPAFSSGVRYYQMVEQIMNDPAFTTVDPNGNRYVNVPIVGKWGESVQKALQSYGIPMVAGLPISVQGNTASLKSVLPEFQLPGLGSIVAVPANLATDWLPFIAPVTSTALGMSYDRGAIDALIPAAWAKNVFYALPIDEQNKALNNAVLGALASAYYHNQTPSPSASPVELQDFIDRIMNNARSILLLKAGLNILSPLAPKVEQVDFGFREEFIKLAKDKYNGNFADALPEFLGTHGERAISYTIAKTEPTIKNARFPSVQQSLDWINENKKPGGLLSDPKTSTAALYLVPQDDNVKDPNSLSIFNEYIRQHLRQTRTPEEFLKQFYISQGNNFIAPYRDQHNQILEQARQSRDTYTAQQETQRWSAIMTKMKNLYPIWYADYTSSEGRTNAELAISQLQYIYSNPSLTPTHEQGKLVGALLRDYNNYMGKIQQYRDFNITGVIVDLEKQNWQAYLDRLKTNDQRLATVINGVFSKVD